MMAGCASAPVATDLETVEANPNQFRNRYIEITAPVLENPPPQGDQYRTWTFIVGASDTHRIMVSEEGFNPGTIEKAYRLVERTRKAGDDVTVIGRLRVGPYREIKSGAEIELSSVRYRGVEINADSGPFVTNYYYPYYDPFFYNGPFFWPHRHYHPYW
jgi:hypothetical protein